MKTPEEIKKGLECCANGNLACEGRCVYEDDCCFPDCKEELQLDALAYIKQLESKVPRWISVEERLPEKYTPVVIAYKDRWGDMDSGLGVLCDSGEWVGYGMAIEPGSVTHWMPLPEPPVEE